MKVSPETKEQILKIIHIALNIPYAKIILNNQLSRIDVEINKVVLICYFAGDRVRSKLKTTQFSLIDNKETREVTPYELLALVQVELGRVARGKEHAG